MLVALLSGMILLAAVQIIGRNFFATTWFLGDEVLRILVLWLTLAGALAASRADKHISISLVDQFLKGRWVIALRVVNHAFTAAVCALIAWFSFQFVQGSHEFGDTLLGGMPAWPVQAVLPLGFGLMAWRHFIHAVCAIIGLAKDEAP